MKYEDIKQYERKFVKILLKNNYRYSGIISEVNETSLKITDKFQQIVTIDLDNISVITPINEAWRKNDF